MDIKSLLKERNLPTLKSREEMKDILQREEYGYLPSVDFTMSVSEPTYIYGEFMCGNVEHSFVNMTIFKRYSYTIIIFFYFVSPRISR